MIFYSPENGGGAGAVDSARADAPAASPASGAAPATSDAGLSQTNGTPAEGTASIIASTTREGTATYVQPDGSFVPEWTNKLPEDLGDARQGFGKYKTVDDLVRGLHSANQLIGRKGVILPTKDSTPEEVAQFHKTMGVPETPDGYMESAKQIEMPEGIQWSDELAKSYFELAHQHHIPATAMRDLIQLNMKQREFENQAAQQQVVEQKQQNLQQLRRVWGADFDRNIGMAQRAAALTGVDANSYGWRDPEVVKGFVRLAKMMSDDKLVSPGGSLPAGSADLKARAMDIMRNPQNPDHQKYRDGDQDVQQRVRRYLEQSGG